MATTSTACRIICSIPSIYGRFGFGGGGLRRDRQGDDERRTGAWSRAFRGDRSLVGLHQLLGDREPEPHASKPTPHRIIRLPEALEHVRQERSEEHTSELQSRL